MKARRKTEMNARRSPAVTARWILFAALLVLLPALAPRAAGAASGPPSTSTLSPLKEIGFDQKLGAQVPLDLAFRDETGRAVSLRDYFGRRPVILSLAYYDCPMLCGMALQGLSSSLKTLSFDAGNQFEVVTVSFNPKNTPEQARLKKATYMAEYGRPGASTGWHFLTGDQDAITELTKAVGFRYTWDEAQQQYAHGTGIVVLTSDGRVSRYFFGIDYAPKDLRLGLMESGKGGIGSFTDTLLLLCYHYDPQTGRYSLAAMNAVRLGGVITLAGLCAFVVVMLRRERAQVRIQQREIG
jgi:protein SCO1/2